ncbi:hypothetical protein LRP31_25615 [Mesorhizobium mediterraneum]|nr:hypothetical protein [Mesorhizobium mediterraneum]WIW52401.1 hypothetical protein LRP31_25615 [Mesorhizobium mediterraneum]
MGRRETKHYVQQEKKMSSVDMAGEASGFVRRMVENETRGWGDMDNALTRLEAKYGLPFWTLQNLRTGRAKTVEASMFNRIKIAFVDQCRRHAERLLHEAEMAKVGNPNVDLADIENQIRALAAKLAAAKGNQERAA